MKPATLIAATALAGLAAGTAPAAAPDRRLRDLAFDANTVVTVPVKRGIVTLIVLDPDEAIAEVAAGRGSDCSKPDLPWCIAAQPGGRTLFVKPKASASQSNNLTVVTDRRTHAFRFDLLADEDPRQAIYRLRISAPPKAPSPPKPAPRSAAPLIELPPLPAPPSPQQLVTERLLAKPALLNTQYSIAEGANSQDIAPTLIFDDGRFTYLRFPGNRDLPAVFNVLADGSEALANSRMEDDLMVVDRVGLRLMLRAGSAVVGVWNDAFDLDGRPPNEGTTVAGVQRVLKDNRALQAKPTDSSISGGAP